MTLPLQPKIDRVMQYDSMTTGEDEMKSIIAELVDRLQIVHTGVILARGEKQVQAACDAADLSQPFRNLSSTSEA